jgi:glycosyltransferase involved in cell wall biosynthesis
LVVSYYFPPDAAVGGKRIARFCKYLPEHRINPIVLTVDEASCEFLDPSYPTPDNLSVHRVRPEKTPLDWYRDLSRRKNGSAAEKLDYPNSAATISLAPQKSALRDHLLALLTVPDKHWGWSKPALRKAAEIVRDARVDLVFSSGPPWTTHSIARRVARAYGLPWIADFRDGWVSDQWRTGLPCWRDWVDATMEAACLRDAAVVTCTTDQLRDSLSGSHPELQVEKFVTVSNGFDSELNDGFIPDEPSGKQLLFLHAGQLYGGRRIDSFCRAVQSMLEARQLPRDVKVRFVGDVDEDISASARAAAPELFRSGTISLLPTVPWEEVQRMIRQARVLLIVQGDHPTAIPAKFFEYLQTGKPILGIAQDGALKDIILRSESGLVADPRDSKGMESVILDSLRLERRSREEIKKVSSHYHFRNLTAQLARQMESIMATSQAR